MAQEGCPHHCHRSKECPGASSSPLPDAFDPILRRCSVVKVDKRLALVGRNGFQLDFHPCSTKMDSGFWKEKLAAHFNEKIKSSSCSR